MAVTEEFLGTLDSRDKRLLASSCTSAARLSTCMNAAPTGQIFMKFDIGNLPEHLSTYPKFG
jgi:hypothetical protein